MLNGTQEMMKEEILADLERGEELSSIKDREGEIIEGFMPVYNNDIIQAWQEMPSEYDNRGGAELVHMEEVTIIGLMSLDLYLYLSDLLSEVMYEVEKELADKEVSA